MGGDRVSIKPDCVARFREKRALGRLELYATLGLNPATGAKLLAGKPVSLRTAKQVARVIHVRITDLIESWADDKQTDSE